MAYRRRSRLRRGRKGRRRSVSRRRRRPIRALRIGYRM